MKKFLISTLAIVFMVASMVSITTAATTTFVDIQDSYAKDAIIELQTKGIINGMNDTNFDPKGTLTRTQFVTIIVKALGLEAKATKSAFTDVTDWAIPYVEAAAKAGVVEGVSNNSFAPNEHITREAAVTILVRSLKTKGKLDETATVTFTDANKISDWAKPFIAAALKYGLISGYPDGTFDPQGIANREMAAIMGKNLLVSIDIVVKATPVPTTQVPTDPNLEPTPTTPILGGGGGSSRSRNTDNTPKQEVPTISNGKATFSNGTTVEGLPAGATIAAKVATVTTVQGIATAGQAMDFIFTGTMPAEGVVLKLPTTSNEAGLSYFNTDRNKWELQEGSTIVTEGNQTFVQATIHHFSIYGPLVKSAQLIADSIATIITPKKDATKFALPTVIGGYTIAIKSSDKPDVIALDGTINPPSVDTTVALVIEVTKTSDGSKAVTVSFNVVVPAKSVVVPVLSHVATVTSSVYYVVSTGGTANETITNVTYGTNKADFLTGLVKGEANQTWNVSGIHDPVVTGDKLVVTAQDGTTKVTYTINGSPSTQDTTPPVIGAHSTLGLIAQAYDNPNTGLDGGFADYIDTNLSVNEPLQSLVITAYAGNPSDANVPTLKVTGTVGDITKIEYSTSYALGEHNTHEELDNFFRALNTATNPKVKIIATDIAGNHTTTIIDLVLSGFIPDTTAPTINNVALTVDNGLVLNFSVSEAVYLGLNSNADIQIKYFTKTGETLTPISNTNNGNNLVKNKHWDGYLWDVANSVNYSQGDAGNTAYSNQISANTQLATLVRQGYHTNGDMNYVAIDWHQAATYVVQIKVIDGAGNQSLVKEVTASVITGSDATQFLQAQDYSKGLDGYNLGFQLNLANLSYYSISSMTGNIYDGTTLIGQVVVDTPRVQKFKEDDAAYGGLDGQLSFDFHTDSYLDTTSGYGGDIPNHPTSYMIYTMPLPENYNITAIPTSATIVVATKSGSTITIDYTYAAIPPVAATLTTTGATGIHGTKVYQQFELTAGGQSISLDSNNIYSMYVQKPNLTITKLVPDADTSLWFNVQNTVGDYKYTIVARSGTTYEATLHWNGTQTVEVRRTANPPVMNGGIEYQEYLLIDSSQHEVNLSSFNAMYQIKSPTGGTVTVGGPYTAAGDSANILYVPTNKALGTYTWLVKNGDVWSEGILTLVADFAVGQGTLADPYEVSTAVQLYNARYHLSNHFKLTSDIDLNVAPYNTGAGWLPIGDLSNKFQGTFNGNGFVVKNLFSNRTTEGVGLFAAIGETGTIDNVAIQGVNLTGAKSVGAVAGRIYQGGIVKNSSVITGQFQSVLNPAIVRSDAYVGGLVGYNRGGTIENSSTSAVTIHGDNRLGGLVGNNWGIIKNSHVTAAAISGVFELGGLAGLNNTDTTGAVTIPAVIENSYADATVTGSADEARVGGIAGENAAALIKNSYAIGSVSGRTYVGGITSSNTGTILNSYAANMFAFGPSIIGGVTGQNVGGTVTSSYYDSHTTGQRDTGKGTSKTTAEMQTQVTFVGWDFTNIWTLPTGQYPQLQ